MALSIFEDKSTVPNKKDVVSVLGDRVAYWDEIIYYIANECKDVSEEWKNYGKASGWTLVIKNKKRTIVSLFPQVRGFILLIVLGEKAVQKALTADIPHPILECIKEAKPYVEGRSVRFKIESELDLTGIKEIIDIKINT